MKIKDVNIPLSAIAVFALAMFLGDGWFLTVPVVLAHCDTMEGPVVKAAQKALETGTVDRILIWVQEKDESEIKKAFEKTLSVRKLSPEARELADMYFFETLVRVHRAGEGESYTGIKPAGTEVEPGIEAADAAFESGSADALIKEISTEMATGVGERFGALMERKKHKGESVEAGREFVESYVGFIHYIEKLHIAVTEEAGHGAGERF